MAKFIYSYFGGSAGTTDEERAKTMEDWKAWAGRMGKSLADFGNPTGKEKTVTKDGAKDGFSGERINGYSIVEADDIEAAAKLADGHPHFDSGGTIDVYELMDM